MGMSGSLESVGGATGKEINFGNAGDSKLLVVQVLVQELDISSQQ